MERLGRGTRRRAWAGGNYAKGRRAGERKCAGVLGSHKCLLSVRQASVLRVRSRAPCEEGMKDVAETGSVIGECVGVFQGWAVLWVVKGHGSETVVVIRHALIIISLPSLSSLSRILFISNQTRTAYVSMVSDGGSGREIRRWLCGCILTHDLWD